MTRLLWVLNRIVAPFFCGFCMAAATAVDDPYAVTFLIGYAGVFAFLSFELGSRIRARFTRRMA